MRRVLRVVSCNKCGALAAVPDGKVADMQPDEVLARCAIVYELDGGPEACEGEVLPMGFLSLDIGEFTR